MNGAYLPPRESFRPDTRVFQPFGMEEKHQTAEEGIEYRATRGVCCKQPVWFGDVPPCYIHCLGGARVMIGCNARHTKRQWKECEACMKGQVIPAEDLVAKIMLFSADKQSDFLTLYGYTFVRAGKAILFRTMCSEQHCFDLSSVIQRVKTHGHIAQDPDEAASPSHEGESVVADAISEGS